MMTLRFSPYSPSSVSPTKRSSIGATHASQKAQKASNSSGPLFAGPTNSTTGSGNWTLPSHPPSSTPTSSGYPANDPVPVAESVPLVAATLTAIGIILYASHRRNKKNQPANQPPV